MTIETSRPLESTRRYASQAMERASSTVHGLRAGASERASAASRAVGEYATVGRQYVTEHPLKAALVAAVIGAAVAGIVIAMRHHRERDNWF